MENVLSQRKFMTRPTYTAMELYSLLPLIANSRTLNGLKTMRNALGEGLALVGYAAAMEVLNVTGLSESIKTVVLMVLFLIHRPKLTAS
jgi:hypothetical protein